MATMQECGTEMLQKSLRQAESLANGVVKQAVDKVAGIIGDDFDAFLQGKLATAVSYSDVQWFAIFGLKMATRELITSELFRREMECAANG